MHRDLGDIISRGVPAVTQVHTKKAGATAKAHPTAELDAVQRARPWFTSIISQATMESCLCARERAQSRR